MLVKKLLQKNKSFLANLNSKFTKLLCRVLKTLNNFELLFNFFTI
jgi:hypothetical protein